MEKNKQWKWARTSENVTAVKAIESQYLHTFKMSKRLTPVKKEELKKKKTARTLKLLDLCKEHQGPVTADSVDILENLSDKELINEICFLRATVAPEI